ncbi:MAG: alkaline phosphatase [Alistipes sp.]|nr:alkaline phosphatase [Alistipes sp.]
MMKRVLTLVSLLLVAVITVTAQPKYIFLFIGDGLGINHVYGTELYNAAVHPDMPNGGLMSFSRFPIRTYVTNHSSSSLVTDSSAAATALASGVKTVNGYMGVDAEKRSVKNMTELVSEMGMKVGVVTNVGMNHATPSAFFAHDESRSAYKSLYEQYLASEVDFAAGATILYRKRDGLQLEDYIAQAKDAKIEVVHDLNAAAKVRGKRVLLIPEKPKSKTLEYANDCQPGDWTIVDFTDVAIKYLEREAKKDGFFLMVEAGHLDYCAHDNDAVTTFEEVNDLSESVQLALDFYNKHPEETLIIVTADHETGGLALGYSNYKMNMERLAWQRCSTLALTGKMRAMRERGETSWEQMQELLRKELGFWDNVRLRKKDEQLLRKTFENSFVANNEEVVSLYSHNEKLAYVAVEILNKRAYIKWISLNHTGMQVPLYVKGAGIEHFYNCYDNTDIPKSIARSLGTTLGE